MIPLGFSTTWQRLAVFDGLFARLFVPVQNRVTKGSEATTFSRWRASVCQNRYPSPSRWPVQRYLDGSPWFCAFWRVCADFLGQLTYVIAQTSGLLLSSGTETFPTSKAKGNQCKRFHLSSCSPPSSALRPATNLIRIWKGLLLAPQSAALQARFLLTASASKAQSSVVQWALFPTDHRKAERAALGATKNPGRPDIGRPRMIYADCAFVRAFVIAYQAIKSLFVSQGSTQNNNRGNSKCKNHSFLSRPLLVLLAARKALILNARPLAGLRAVWQATLSTKAIALSVPLSAPLLAHCQTTSTSKFGPNRALHFSNNAEGVRFRAPLGVPEGHLCHV